MSCLAMRAHALAHCCCPALAAGAARLTCCTVEDGSGVTTTPAREQTKELQLAPILAATDFSYPSDGFHVAPTTTARALLASAAGPPPVPLRI